MSRAGILFGLIKSWFDGEKFKRDLPCAGDVEVILWWESRRFFFNYVVGLAGILTCILCLICAFTSEPIVGEAIGLPDGPLLGVFGIFFYGILANVFYTGGWICELLLRRATTAERAAAFGVRAFRLGLQFSVILTLLPSVLCWGAFGIALLHGQTEAPVIE